MTMRILFFAHLKTVADCASVELAAPQPLNVEQLWAELLRQFPGLAPHRNFTRLAKNWEYVGTDAIFAADDEVALIPPVSGG